MESFEIQQILLFLLGRKNSFRNQHFICLKTENKLRQELANFFCNRPDSKYFRLFLASLLQHCSNLLSQHQSCHRQYVNKRAWSCCSKTLRTLKFGFHRFFSCIIKYYSFGFLSAIKKHKKPFLEPMGCQENRWWVVFGCPQENMGNNQFSLMG